MKTAEYLAASQNRKTAIAARMNELVSTTTEAGTTMDAAQAQEFDDLKLELKNLDAHIARLNDVEEINRASAQPVGGATPQDGAAARDVTRVVQVKDNRPEYSDFIRYAMVLATAKGNIPLAYEMSKSRYPDCPRIHTILKAAVSAGTTTDTTWAGALVQYQNFAGDFIDYLRPQTIVGRIPGLRRVPFNIQVGGQTSGGSASWVGQGKPKPLTKVDFTTVRLGFAKVANIAVLTEEVVRFSSPSAEQLVRDALTAAIVERMDTDFVDPAKAAVSDVSPASITHGITPLASNGTDSDGVRADLEALLGHFITYNIDPANLVFIMPSSTALAISLMRTTLGETVFDGITMKGGTLLGIPVVTSQYVSLAGSPMNNLLILLNASDVYLADDGQVTIDASREASLEMSDSPTNSSATHTATSLVSLWQTNSIGLRAERFVNWARRRDAGVAFINHVAYSSAAAA